MFCFFVIRGRSWSADRAHVEMGSGSREWTGTGTGRRRAGKHAGGRKQVFDQRPEQTRTDFRNTRSAR